MRDALGWRLKLGVMAPSTNTIVQPDMDDMRPHGVTNHYSRIFTPNAAALSNDTFRAGIQTIGDNVLAAVDSVMTCEPDYLVMGISALSFFGGANGADAFVRGIEARSGRKVTVGSHAMAAALETYGGVKRLALLTPYWPVMNAEVIRYFGDMGFTVVRDISLECRSWIGIAEVTTAQCRETLRRLDGDDVDALIQVGTNLSMIRLAAAAELWLGKPVVAINTATYWHALRANGIADKVPGYGRLLEEW
ncbi:MAG: Asp/Glu racemase [Hyphomicrobiaceae bacterium]|nr:Asp/Glu racemase [Hyphomicrobiaceae bacterium]